MAQYALGKIAISIHAPTRGATLVELEKTMNEIISIHAPTRGATLCGNRISRLLLFQSTLLQEERQGSDKVNLLTQIFQSTLLQEERQCVPYKKHNCFYFNPRSYKRSDLLESLGIEDNIISIHAPTRGATSASIVTTASIRFQSTLLQEERQQKCTIFLMHLCNNYCIVSI